MWTLASAQDFVSIHQHRAWEAGWNLCMGGGVVNNGKSDNDFDLVAIPKDVTSTNYALLTIFLLHWDWQVTYDLPCAHVYRLRADDGRIIELHAMKCGQNTKVILTKQG